MFNGLNNVVAGLLALLAAGLTGAVVWLTGSWTLGAVALVVGLVVAAAPRMVAQWQRGVRLRLGRYRGLLEPGITWVIPGIDTIPAVVDLRVRSTPFRAEKALTRDTVPVNVDAVLFWQVVNAERAILELRNFEPTVSWVAQTTLRDVIGRNDLGRMIAERETLDRELRETIDAKTENWGVKIESVEIRDVNIPDALEDAMSRTAQAEREKRAPPCSKTLTSNNRLRQPELCCLAIAMPYQPAQPLAAGGAACGRPADPPAGDALPPPGAAALGGSGPRTRLRRG